MSSARQEAISAEWARYREKAVRAVKVGRVPPEFVSEVLPRDQHAWVAERLAVCATVDAVRAVFAEAREREQSPDQAAHPLQTDVSLQSVTFADMATFQQLLRSEALAERRALRSLVLEALGQ